MLKKDKHIQSCKNSTRSKLKWANSAKLDFGEEPQNNCFCVTVASMFFVGLWPSFCSFSCYTRVVARMQHHQTSIIFLELIKAHEKIHTYSTLFYSDMSNTIILNIERTLTSFSNIELEDLLNYSSNWLKYIFWNIEWTQHSSPESGPNPKVNNHPESIWNMVWLFMPVEKNLFRKFFIGGPSRKF